MKQADTMLMSIPKLIVGRIIKINARQKMIKVAIERSDRHPVYGKVLRRTTNLNVHWDNEQKVGVGDLVAVMQCRPISKIKRHAFVRKIRDANRQ